MEIRLPKKAPQSLLKRAEKARWQITNGTAKLRKSERYGYWTVVLGYRERIVLFDNSLYVFTKHCEYEKFINTKKAI